MSYSNSIDNNQSFFNALLMAAVAVALSLSLVVFITKPNPTIEYAKLERIEDPVEPASSRGKPITPPEPTIAARPHTYTHRLGFSFVDKDLDLYRKVFSLQEDGEWDNADYWLRQIQDHVLLGSALAQRYIHKDYVSSFNELAAWLDNYSDMPIAERIYALAKRKQPAGKHLPHIHLSDKQLQGVGTRDGMKGEVMPKAWRAGLDAWIEKEYHTATQIFKTVADEPGISQWHRSAANFWAYRAAKRAGYKEQSEIHLKLAAEAPFTLHGTLARHALGNQEPLRAELPTIDKYIQRIPAVKRAAAYVALDRMEDADEELRHLYVQLPIKQKKQLITIAAKLNLPALQLRMSQMLYRDPAKSNGAAYPIPQWVPSYDMEVHPALVFAIARQESGFDKDAKSRAGARGIMQLMPTTAEYILRKNTDINSLMQSPDDLHDPAINLVLGQEYLKYLSDKPFIQSNLIHTIAAYNAGPTNLREWTKRYRAIHDPLLFVELIPFKETRHYVKQVLSNYVIYNELLHGRSDESFALIQGKWPTISTSGSRLAAIMPRRVATLQQLAK